MYLCRSVEHLTKKISANIYYENIQITHNPSNKEKTHTYTIRWKIHPQKLKHKKWNCKTSFKNFDINIKLVE